MGYNFGIQAFLSICHIEEEHLWFTLSVRKLSAKKKLDDFVKLKIQRFYSFLRNNSHKSHDSEKKINLTNSQAQFQSTPYPETHTTKVVCGKTIGIKLILKSTILKYECVMEFLFLDFFDIFNGAGKAKKLTFKNDGVNYFDQ